MFFSSSFISSISCKWSSMTLTSPITSLGGRQKTFLTLQDLKILSSVQMNPEPRYYLSFSSYVSFLWRTEEEQKTSGGEDCGLLSPKDLHLDWTGLAGHCQQHMWSTMTSHLRAGTRKHLYGKPLARSVQSRSTPIYPIAASLFSHSRGLDVRIEFYLTLTVFQTVGFDLYKF